MTDQRFLRRREVEQRTGLSRSTLYNYIATGRFPAPFRLTAKAVGWRESDVQAWCASRERVTRSAGEAA